VREHAVRPQESSFALAAYSLSNHSPVICAPCSATAGVSVSGVLLVAHVLACREEPKPAPAGPNFASQMAVQARRVCTPLQRSRGFGSHDGCNRPRYPEQARDDLDRAKGWGYADDAW
jgi:hypothetical protein